MPSLKLPVNTSFISSAGEWQRKPLQTWYHDSLSTLLLLHGMLLAIYGLHLFRCVTSRTCTISHACRNILPIVKNSFEEANICSRPKSHAKDLESRQL